MDIFAAAAATAATAAASLAQVNKFVVGATAGNKHQDDDRGH